MTLAAPEADRLSELRAEVRQWCHEHVPTDWMIDQPRDEAGFLSFQRWWFEELRLAGYLVPHWPKEWGGGFSLDEQVVLHEELAAANAPRLSAFLVSLYHAAATLLAVGSESQQRHLSAILEGEIWCQGFSEPNAGSDLASLRTRAFRDGDNYVVNGQKVWSSGAHHADWCLLLARTDPSAPKRAGISYFLLDMRSPGVEVRPIRQANGASEFCELFLTDVVVPAESLVGLENDGWRVAQITLSSERGVTILEASERLRGAYRWLVEAAKQPTAGHSPPIDDPAIREVLADLHTRLRALRLLCRSVIDGLIRNSGNASMASLVKVYFSELLRDMMELGVELDELHCHLAAARPTSCGAVSGVWLLDFVGTWEWSIAGGTNEIQRTVIGERLLGLPRDPSAT